MSEETKWTPGPWFQDKHGNLKAEQSKCSRKRVGFSGLCLTAGKEAEANTTLASAAPDLYDALELLVDTNDSGGWPSAAIVIARAALAKARGEG